MADKVESGELQSEDLIDTTLLGNTRLSNTNLTEAERRQAYAILTYMNGNKPLTYDDYVKMCKQQGIKPGEKIAVKQNSYLFTNRQEDKRHMEPIVNGNGLLAGIINAGARMWHDPNRGRLGSWMF